MTLYSLSGVGDGVGEFNRSGTILINKQINMSNHMRYNFNNLYIYICDDSVDVNNVIIVTNSNNVTMYICIIRASQVTIFNYFFVIRNNVYSEKMMV